MATSSAETVDEKLIAWYLEASSGGLQFHGLSILPHARELGILIRATGSTRLLDYGSGCGHQYGKHHRLHERWGVPQPTLYDPGVAGLEAKPAGTFDGVICSDVMEHVPERLVPAVLAEVFAYAEKFVWISVCCRPAKKKFPDGTNMHVTVRPQEWWVPLVRDVAAGKRFDLVFTP